MVLFTPRAGKLLIAADRGRPDPAADGRLECYRNRTDAKKMTQFIVLSVVGPDRAGVVNDLTKVVLDCGGNIEESRMVALGSEFAMLLLISGNWHTLNKLESALDRLADRHDLTVTFKKTDERQGQEECMPYLVDVVCLDQPGIVFNLAHFFATRNIEISEVATRRYAAAHTGAPMFSVHMTVSLPPSVHISQLRDEFLEVCDRLNLDALLEPVKS